MERLSNWYFLENSAIDLILFASVLIVGFAFKRIISNSFSKIVLRFFTDSSITVEDCIQQLRKPFELLTFWIFLYFATQNLRVPNAWHWVSIENFGIRFLIAKSFESALILTITWVIIRLVKVGILVAQVKWQGIEQKSKQHFIPFLNDLSLVFIIAGAGFVLLGRVFEVDVVALITGLGLGGLALALAARETLENLFASFTIFLDLPFVVGDSIQVGVITGDIEKIGFRSTRLRGNDGNLIVIPNRLLTSQSLENLTERDYRRAKFNITCDLKTTPAQINATIESITADILQENLCKKKEPKVVFEGFGAYSLDISVMFYVETKDLSVFQQTKQRINMRILEILEQEKITLASSVSA
ncbi:mechanosensitive ion channel family protein [Aquirufa regiilacus]|uniref:Mechanosensitive ion channel n=1 Tax=Aquirufa regiilacus TaxID=3024868 RepID=A0ABU3TNZ9_9BACT|nr:mechanosensitive ion channel domain-containing protein [Aquirufa sp. LEOWEIH-7C]MDU0807591.1 mechanosensitive ion channel [Aquirufa sp. LEOWEIH-7C]